MKTKIVCLLVFLFTFVAPPAQAAPVGDTSMPAGDVLTPVVTNIPPNMGEFYGYCPTCLGMEPDVYINATVVVRYRIDAGDHNIWYIVLGQFIGMQDGVPMYRAPLKIYADEWETYSQDGCLLLQDVGGTVVPKEGSDGQQVSLSSDGRVNASQVCAPRQVYLPITVNN